MNEIAYKISSPRRLHEPKKYIGIRFESGSCYFEEPKEPYDFDE